MLTGGELAPCMLTRRLLFQCATWLRSVFIVQLAVLRVFAGSGVGDGVALVLLGSYLQKYTVTEKERLGEKITQGWDPN